jgi:AcrR family transcriptional regulator
MTKQKIATRKPLSSARVLRAAVALADEAGLEAFSMRGLAQELGVVPMALYKHVASKEELLDGMVDIVFSEIELPSEDLDWRSAMRRRAMSTREALKRHSWAIGMMESRHPGPANLRNHNAVMGCLRGAGFSFEMAVHAYSVQDAYIYGFAVQDRDLAFETSDSAGQAAQRRAQRIGALEDHPYLVEIATKLPQSGYDSAAEFTWGLDLILDGLEQLRLTGATPASELGGRAPSRLPKDGDAGRY